LLVALCLVTGKCGKYVRKCTSWNRYNDVLYVTDSRGDPVQLIRERSRMSRDCQTMEVQTKTTYSLVGCTEATDNHLECNITLTDAKVLWNHDYFAEKEIVCDPDVSDRWVDVTSVSCVFDDVDVFDYLKYSLNDMDRKELYIDDNLFRMDGINYSWNGYCGIDWKAVGMWFYFTCCGLIFVLLVYRSLYYHLQLQDVKAINKKHREKKLSPEPIPTEKVKT
ncbi:hypothetical protein WA538_003972, partial [Blastocystis sp. DL]